MYHGAGWIRGAGASVTTQASQAFAEPRHSSEIVLQVVGGETLESMPTALRAIVACDGPPVINRE
jgi:hypothetical protein